MTNREQEKRQIELKNRWDGSVIYVAKGARDVREAVEAARHEGANLWGADLRRADLWGADLRGASLRGANLREANLREASLRGADLWRANLWRADLWRASLWGADLREASLRGANLREANLWRADLREANLWGADLRGASLWEANGINPHAVNDLLLLQHQVGKIRMYKVVTKDGRGPFNGGITYEVGETYEVAEADCDPSVQCAAGIHLATLPWCINEWRPGYRILLCEFTAKDIAAIPIGDGKFRVKKCKVVKELDLAEIGVSHDQ